MNASTTPPLLFNWDPPRGRNLAITGFLIASLGAHAACFYLFQIVYPPTGSLTPAPRRVNLISANSEEGTTLLRWVDAEDPALASTTRRPSGAKLHLLANAQHIPSYFASEPNLKEAPPLTVDLRVPSAQSPGPVPAPRRARAKPVEAAPTKVTFSNELDRIGQPKFVTANFKASAHEPPQNAQFRIAVDEQGAVPARLVLRGAEGSTSNGNSLVWGMATIEWGNDVAAANAKPTPGAP